MKYQTVLNAEALCGTGNARIRTANTTGTRCRTRRKKNGNFSSSKRGLGDIE